MRAAPALNRQSVPRSAIDIALVTGAQQLYAISQIPFFRGGGERLL